MIYTTYFAMLRHLPENITSISICAKAPKGFDGLEYKKLAPKYDTLMDWKKNHDEMVYVEEYMKTVLNKLDPMKVYQELCSLAKNSEIALVCYEKSSDFCHRHLVANWLEERGFDVAEWKR